MHAPLVFAATGRAGAINDDLALAWVDGAMAAQEASAKGSHAFADLLVAQEGAKELQWFRSGAGRHPLCQGCGGVWLVGWLKRGNARWPG